MRFRRALALVPSALWLGCVLDWNALRGGAEDAGADAADDDTGADTRPPCAPRLVINELKADGTVSSDEFVELYNDATCTASLQGFTLSYSSQSGSSPLLIWTGAAEDFIEAKGYFLLTGEGFTPPATTAPVRKWQNLSAPANGILGKNGGGVGLFAPQSGGVLIDAVAYATISTPAHPFIRPPKLPDGGASTPAPNPPSGQSIARVPNGATTDTNAADFKVATPTPGTAN